MRACPVTIGPGLLADGLPAFVAGQGFSQAAIVTNETVGLLYGDALRARLPGSALIAVPDGEQFKTLATVEAIFDSLIAHHADRATAIVALGGGVVTDMAGFAAATFMRGVPLIMAPTSLLAMVDASIGGKVGVDLPQGKNLVGAFKEPLAVFADTRTLGTLPAVEKACGLAEMIKAGLIGDPALLDLLRAPDSVDLDGLIGRAVAVKVGIVEQDWLEHGPRMLLNLGHTFGHALEQASGYRWRHGEAVAVGLAAAARLSARLGLCDAALVEEVEALLGGCGLPARYRGFRPGTLWNIMQHDKKWAAGTSRFVLLEGRGRAVVVEDVPREAVVAVLAELREGA